MDASALDEIALSGWPESWFWVPPVLLEDWRWRIVADSGSEPDFIQTMCMNCMREMYKAET